MTALAGRPLAEGEGARTVTLCASPAPPCDPPPPLLGCSHTELHSSLLPPGPPALTLLLPLGRKPALPSPAAPGSPRAPPPARLPPSRRPAPPASLLPLPGARGVPRAEA